METLIQYTPRDLVNTWTTTVLALRGVPSQNADAVMNNMNGEQLRSLITQGSNLLNTAPRHQVAYHPVDQFVLWAHGLRRLLRILHWPFCDQA